MDERKFLAERFEAHRAHLRAVAYRMLGSPSEADDAVQEAWLHVARAGAGGVDNLGGWMTTIVARVCLDMLRARKSRREEPREANEAPEAPAAATDPEREALLADSVGLALLVVLDTLAPAERLAFVLHEMFGVSFDEIARIVGRSPAAARQLASRARRRVRGAGAPDAGLAEQRGIVAAFLSALRGGDLEAIVAVLDPNVVVRVDAFASPPSGREVHGARAWAKGAVAFTRSVGAGTAQAAMVDDAVGVVLAPGGRLSRVLRLTFAGGKIAAIEIVADPARLRGMKLGVLDDAPRG